MKRNVNKLVFTVGVVLLSLSCNAQDTVFGVFPNYYYNWYQYWQTCISHDDAYVCTMFWKRQLFRPLSDDRQVTEFPIYPETNRVPQKEFAIEMHPDTTLKVIGIAFTDASFGSRRHYYDGSLYEDLDYVPDYVLYNEDSIMCGNTELGLSRNLATVHYNIYDKNMALIYTQSRCLADESVSRYIEMGLLKFK